MQLKSRTESKELLVLRYLNRRMTLDEKDHFHYLNLEKGYEGELKFDQLLTENLNEERYILNELLFDINHSYFQIDTTIISQGVIHLLDIKNYEGDYYFDGDKLYSLKTGREYKNPVIQLKRSATLFRQLLQNLKQNYLVESQVIFINPEFTLYQAPMDQPIILPSQVNRFLRDLNSISSKLNDGHKKLAQKLISLHQKEYPYTELPKYSFEEQRKGVTCAKCHSFSVEVHGKSCICKDCGYRELVSTAVVRSVEEFKTLYPKRKITTNSIYEWCQIVDSKETISRILGKNYKMIGVHQWAYYE